MPASFGIRHALRNCEFTAAFSALFGRDPTLRLQFSDKGG